MSAELKTARPGRQMPPHTNFTNPLIGFHRDDTLANCRQVIAVLQDSTEAQVRSKGVDMGLFLVLDCVSQALKWEEGKG